MVCRTGVIFFYFFLFFAFFRLVETDLPGRACLALLARFAFTFARLKNRLFCRQPGNAFNTVRVSWDQPALRQRAFLWLLTLLVLVKAHKARGRPRKSMSLDVHKIRIWFVTHKGLICLTWSQFAYFQSRFTCLRTCCFKRGLTACMRAISTLITFNSTSLCIRTKDWGGGCVDDSSLYQIWR